MASHNNSHLFIFEPICFHRMHGEQIRLSENNTRATRDRLNDTLLFTNRPILAQEIVEVLVEELATDFYGVIRIGLTTVDPGSLTKATLPKVMPPNDAQWFVQTPRLVPTIIKNNVIRLQYTAEGDIYLDYNGTGFNKCLTVSPITKDVWCTIDMNGTICQIRLVQRESRALPNPVDRARARFLSYTNNRQNENSSIYYSDALQAGTVTMNNCDEHCEISDNIAVRKSLTSSVIIDENLKRSMYMVMQILDMDHTLSAFLTIRCLTNGHSSNEHTKIIDSTFDHVTLGDEIGIRVSKDGTLTFSCNNRYVKPLFNIDLTVNDDRHVEPVSYRIEVILNGRVTAIRLIGIYHPTEEESKPPPAQGGGCLSTVRYRVCPNGLSGLLLPCRHLCVCYDCGQVLVDRHTCPNINCRKPVKGCIKVFKG